MQLHVNRRNRATYEHIMEIERFFYSLGEQLIQ